MELPEKLELTDDRGNPRKNGEERRAINAIVGWLMEQVAEGEAQAAPAPDPAAMDRMTVQTSVPAEWSAAHRDAASEGDVGTVTYTKPGHAYVKHLHGGMFVSATDGETLQQALERHAKEWGVTLVMPDGDPPSAGS